MNDADLGASKPVPKPEPTESEIKEWRARNFTVKHSTVVACGHRLEAGHFPKHANCWDCWYAMFETSPDGVASVHDLLMKEGSKAVAAMHGKKFLAAFGKYLRNKLLLQASPEVQAASGLEPTIEGAVLDIGAERMEAKLGLR
jgi:hypothetical protein